MEKKQTKLLQYKERIRHFLPQIILLLIVSQPLMDILSYWLNTAVGDNKISLLLRMLVLGLTALLGFCLSRRKKIYLLAGGILALFTVIHVYACMHGYMGYGALFADMTNYIRVLQMPLFTFCFITFLRESEEKGCEAVERGMVINFCIIFAVELLSAATHTNPYTYANKQIGLLGWFYFANSQSAVVAAIVPIMLMRLMRQKRVFMVLWGTIAGLGVLYLYATRLTYGSIFLCTFGLIAVMLLSRRWNRRMAAILLAGAILCGAGYTISPMYQNRLAVQQVAMEKQQEANQMIAEAEKKYNTTVEESPELCLQPIYEEYLANMMDRFGADRVMQAYQYTTHVSELKDWRRMKIMYCSFLLQESGKAAKLFGMELEDMTWNGEIYDVENDFYGIYYLYGVVGLGLLLLFLFYFIGLILYGLFTDFRKYMTLQAGGFGIALVTLLLHVYYTAGVLRRPNASFYLSVALAVIYYLVRVKSYHKEESV